jgi:Tetratricopeptide repeat
MTSERVQRRGALARAEADLARGRTYAAIRRLRSLLVADPADLEVRSRLARAYRRTGNLTEAGRWAYLTAELRPDEEAAFLRAYPSPWVRLRVLRFVGTPEVLPREAADRLRRLVVAAQIAGPPRPRPAILPGADEEQDRRHGSLVPCLVVVLSFALLSALAVIGAVRVWRWWVNF